MHQAEHTACSRVAPNCLERKSHHDNCVLQGLELAPQDLDSEYVKQSSLQSSGSQFTWDPHPQGPSGHVVTTAQNRQVQYWPDPDGVRQSCKLPYLPLAQFWYAMPGLGDSKQLQRLVTSETSQLHMLASHVTLSVTGKVECIIPH